MHSTHALAREPRFSFLLFGFETLKSSHLDSYCENVLRNDLYSAAYSWFAVRPQCEPSLHCRKPTDVLPRWSYGANRVQVDADIKVVSEFLSYLQTDSVRGSVAISSLSPAQSESRSSREHTLSLHEFFHRTLYRIHFQTPQPKPSAQVTRRERNIPAYSMG
jgi:phosphatidylinositol 4-kinase